MIKIRKYASTYIKHLICWIDVFKRHIVVEIRMYKDE
jgi:hypothetical protein